MKKDNPSKSQQQPQNNQETSQVQRPQSSQQKPKMMLDYFKTFEVSQISQKKSDFYAYQRFISVTQQIYNGETQINTEKYDIDSLLVKKEIKEEEQKAKQLRHKKQIIMSQLALLDDQISKTKKKNRRNILASRVSQSLNNSRISSQVLENQEESEHNVTKEGNLVLSKTQHKKLVQKIMNERKQRDKRRELLKCQQEQQIKKKIQQQKIQEQNRKAEEKKRKVGQIQQKLQKQRQIHNKFLQQQKQSAALFRKIKKKKFLHEEIQHKYLLKVQLPLLQEQKKLLREKRQFSKAYSIQQIKNHQKQYNQLRESSIKKMSQMPKRLDEKHFQTYQAPPKSERLEKLLEEQKMLQRKKLIEKKLALEQKLHRQENYVQNLRQKFSTIKIDQSKQLEIQQRLQKTNKRRQIEIDAKTIGMNYLMEAKKRRRKTAHLQSKKLDEQSQNNVPEANLTMLQKEGKKETLSSKSRVSQKPYKNTAQLKKQKIQHLIKDSNCTEAQKIRKLKMQSDKINYAFKMKEQMLKYGRSEKVEEEAIDLLLTCIQAKMGIIESNAS